ncbi:cytochrome P450 [Saccharopolyspora gloriosae]|uniref:Cytochrome P450 n=1 Tax=Saccharopolyspora gloriosae TaxID=455344 RepID=A0A840NLM9_9PSEU|nr:cytochrome P450 [Saccharopolyspora gloriosae]MBB5071023.1 cytochrome P450 [Saccharopolyspora gloriosae]
MTTADETTDPNAVPARPAMRRPLPPELIERGECPFDPPAELGRLRGEGPVAPITLLNGARAWMVTGYREAREAFGDPRFSSDKFRHRDALQLTPEEVAAGTCPHAPESATPSGHGLFIFMDPPEHTRLRRLLIGEFTVRRMRALESRVTELAVELIEDMRAAGNRADLVADFALPLPSLVICELLGVDYADRARFQRSAAVSLNFRLPEQERLRAGAELREFMRELVASKRAAPGDDLLSGLVHGDADPALTDLELVDIATTLLTAGHETTANMLALGTFALLEHPEQLAALRADPALVDGAVEELLRYLSVLHLGTTRVATEDLTLGGVDIAAGDTVLLSIPEADRDPEHWPEPDRLDVARPRSPHLAFGHGVHQCLGQQLARVEMRIGYAELLDRLPGLSLDVPAGDVPLRTDMIVYGVHELPVTWR